MFILPEVSSGECPEGRGQTAPFEGEGAALPLGQPHSTAPGPRAHALRAAPLPSNKVAAPSPAFATWQICEAEDCKFTRFGVS